MCVMKWHRCVAAGILVCTWGCGDPEDRVKLVPVTGRITLNGKPLANAQVAFVPDQGNTGGTAGGDITGPEGNYLARYRNRSGLAPGKYKVHITPGTPTASSSGASEAFQNDPFMAGEAVRAAEAGKPGSKKLEIKGEFDAEVEPGGSTLDFDLKSTAAAANAIK
jgi:hypothetical protein